VRNLGNINGTPFGATLDASTQGLITAMTVAFNTQIADGLSDTAGVIIYDDYGKNAAKPADYSNVTTQSCGPNAFGAPDGSSIICNTTNLIPGDDSKYFFADSVHPTPYTHKLAAATAMSLMVNAGWQ
jgi:phospholipase/lecithinase/hemolysin